MEKTFLDYVNERLVDGESSLSYRQFMLRNFDSWRLISLAEIYAMAKHASERETSLYSFLTFWYNIVGLDLTSFGPLSEENRTLITVNLEGVIDSFPRSLNMSDFSELDEFGLSITAFREIRLRLAREGVEKVRSVKFRWGD